MLIPLKLAAHYVERAEKHRINATEVEQFNAYDIKPAGFKVGHIAPGQGTGLNGSRHPEPTEVPISCGFLAKRAKSSPNWRTRWSEGEPVLKNPL
jgi:hypothetical protein